MQSRTQSTRAFWPGGEHPWRLWDNGLKLFFLLVGCITMAVRQEVGKKFRNPRITSLMLVSMLFFFFFFFLHINHKNYEKTRFELSNTARELFPAAKT